MTLVIKTTRDFEAFVKQLRRRRKRQRLILKLEIEELKDRLADLVFLPNDF